MLKTGVTWGGGMKKGRTKTDTWYMYRRLGQVALCCSGDTQTAAQKLGALIYTAEQRSGFTVHSGMKRQI